MTTISGAGEPYVGNGFDHDIFVSYAHGIRPDSNDDPDLKAWTHALVEKLKEHIGYSLEQQQRSVSVWYDARLSRAAPLTDTLKQRVERSATLLIVMTRPYLASDWCNQELEWFDGELRRRGKGIENIFVVRAMATDQDQWPAFLRDHSGETVLGFPFCNEREGLVARPFGWIDPNQSTTKGQFVDALTMLASEIAIRLDRIRASNIVQPAAMTAGNRNWPVFVAPGTEDTRPHVHETRTLLAQGGCLLLPANDLRIEDLQQHEEDEALAGAQAFVQCLGLIAGKDEGAEIGRVELMDRRAEERALPRFHWRNTQMPLQALDYDPEYRAFVEGVGDLPDRTIAEFVDEVLDFLQAQHGSEDRHTLTAYVDVPAKALGRFDHIKDDISSDDCLLLPLKAPEQGQIDQIQLERKARQQIYMTCDAVMLLYCVADQFSWLTSAIVNFAKDVTATQRKTDHLPLLVVVDFVGEAAALAGQLGVAHIPWQTPADPGELWRQIRELSV